MMISRSKGHTFHARMKKHGDLANRHSGIRLYRDESIWDSRRIVGTLVFVDFIRVVQTALSLTNTGIVHTMELIRL